MFKKAFAVAPLSILAVGPLAQGEIVAKFDLGVTTSAVATGWEPVAVGLNSDNLTSVAGTQNGITVTLFANTVWDARDRGVNSKLINNAVNPGSDPDPLNGELTPVLRDWLFDNGNVQGETATVEFTGLLANTEYNITSIHQETSGGQATFVTNWYENSIAAPNLLGTWNGSRDTVIAPTDFVLLNATSDGTGKITLVAEAATGPLRLNGFTVDVVPEPGSLALLGLGTLLVARRRRG